MSGSVKLGAPAAEDSPLGPHFTERRERGARKVAKKDGVDGWNADEGGGEGRKVYRGGSNAGAKGRKHR